MSDDGKAIARIMVPKGEIDFHSLKRIAELSERYGDKYVYITNRQNFEIHGVDPDKLPELQAEIDKLPVAGGTFFGLDDIVPCVGTTYCPLAVSETRRMYDMLQSVVKREKYDPIRDKAIINITGCPNSCSPYYIADIGMRGMRIREGQGSVEGYEIRLGGTQEQFGQVLGEFKTEDCPRVVEAVLDTFMEIRQGDETLADTVWRHGVAGNPEAPGMAPFRQAVEALHIQYEHGAQAGGVLDLHGRRPHRARSEDDGPRHSLPGRLSRRHECARVHPPTGAEEPRRLVPDQSGRQRLPRRARPHLHPALRTGLPAPVDQHQRPGDDLPPEAGRRRQQVAARAAAAPVVRRTDGQTHRRHRRRPGRSDRRARTEAAGARRRGLRARSRCSAARWPGAFPSSGCRATSCRRKCKAIVDSGIDGAPRRARRPRAPGADGVGVRRRARRRRRDPRHQAEDRRPGRRLPTPSAATTS